MSDAVIALDGLGGDRCPASEIDAARIVGAAGHRLLVTGSAGELAALEGVKGVETLDAPERVTMDDSAAKVVRAKPNSSMALALDAVREGRAAAAVSAGNSGAMLAYSLRKLGRIRGVDRPAIVTTMPTRQEHEVYVLDMGANVVCKPVQLTQFAVMGAVFARVRGMSRPRVGLLSNGSEEGKGTELTRATHGVLATYAGELFTYAGYVEGKDILAGDVDVVVTDGFTGNVALKSIEGTASFLGGLLKEGIHSSLAGKLGALLMRNALGRLRKAMDLDGYGGAPLLGLNGVSVICHGGASGRAIATAVDQARRYVDASFTPQLTAAITDHADLFDAARAGESTT